MASGIKGITIQLAADGSKLTDALYQADKAATSAQKSLENVNKALKFDPTNVDLLKQKQEILKQKIDATKTSVETMKQALAEMDADGVSQTSEKYTALQREIAYAENSLKGMNQELQETQAKASNIGQLGTEFETVGKKLTEVGNQMKVVSAAAAAVATAISAAAVEAGKWADDLNTLSKTSGIATDDLQTYAAAADLVDVSVSTIAKSMTRMKKNMLTASEGTGDAADAFAALGIAVTDANGNLRDQDDVFQETIKALGQMENETERDAYAMQIFGKSATELNPLIEDMGETYANALAYMEEHDIPIVDQETLDQANRFNDAIDNIKMVWSQAVMVIGSNLAGYLAPAMEKVADVLATIAGKVANMNPALLTAIAGIAGIVAAMAPVLLIGGKIATMVGGMLGQIAMLGVKLSSGAGLLSGLWAVLTANPILAVVAAIAALSAAFVAFGGDTDALGEKLSAFVENVLTKAAELIPQIVETITANLPQIVECAVQIVLSLVTGIIKATPQLIKQMPQIIKSIVSSLNSCMGDLVNVGINIVKGLWSGASSMVSWAVSKFKSLGKSILNGIKNALGIHSPSRVFRDQVGKNIVLGIAQGITQNEGKVSKAMSGLSATVTGANMSASYMAVSPSGASASAASSANYGGLADRIVEGMVGALNGAVIQQTTNLDGKTIAKTITPLINSNLGKAQTLTARGV